MTTQCAHAVDHETAKRLPLGVRQEVITPEQAARNVAADMLRTARGACSQSSLADAAGVAQQHVAQWEDTDAVRSPSLLHLVRAAQSRPTVVAAVGRALVLLCTRPQHVARPVQERLCCVMAEVGDVGRAVHQALADGAIDEAERRAVHREIDEAIEVLAQLKRDLDK